MGMRWRGHELAFAQPERQGHVEDLSQIADVHAKKREMGFPLWGGDKTWISPQDRWTDGVPFFDLDSGSYDLQVEEATPERAIIRMVSPICRETGVQISRTVTLRRNASEWVVTHRLSNASSRDVEWGIWDISMVLTPGRVYLPKRADSQHSNGVKTFVTEGESGQVRDTVVGDHGQLAVIACGGSAAFKFGTDGREGWILGILDVDGLGLMGYRKQVPVYEHQPYGHDCIVEVFNSDRYPYCELETHGPVVRLSPGESFELQEQHKLFDVSHWPHSEAEVRQLVTA